MTSLMAPARTLPRRRRTTVGRPRHPMRSPASELMLAISRAVYRAARLVAVGCGRYAARLSRRHLHRERVILGSGFALALAVLLTVLTANAQGTPSSLQVMRKLPAYSLVYPGAALLKETQASSDSQRTSVVTVTRIYGLPMATASSVHPLDVIRWYDARLRAGGWRQVTEQTNGIGDTPFAWATACDHLDLLVEDPSTLSPDDVAGLDLSSDSLVFFVTMDQGCLPQG